MSITVRGTPSSGSGCTEDNSGRTMALGTAGTIFAGDTLVVGILNGTAWYITGATWAATSGGQATYTIGTTQHTQALSNSTPDLIDVYGISPSGYNIRGAAVVSTTASTVVVAMASNPGTYSSGGTLHSSPTITDDKVGGSNTYTFINETALVNNSFGDANGILLYYAKNVSLNGSSALNLTVNMNYSTPGGDGSFVVAAGGIDITSPLDSHGELISPTNAPEPFIGASTAGNFFPELYVTIGFGDGVTNGMAVNQGVTFTGGGTGCMQGNGYGFFVSSGGFPGGLAAKFTETSFANQATASIIASFKAAGANPATNPGSTWGAKTMLSNGIFH